MKGVVGAADQTMKGLGATAVGAFIVTGRTGILHAAYRGGLAYWVIRLIALHPIITILFLAYAFINGAFEDGLSFSQAMHELPGFLCISVMFFAGIFAVIFGLGGCPGMALLCILIFCVTAPGGCTISSTKQASTSATAAAEDRTAAIMPFIRGDGKESALPSELQSGHLHYAPAPGNMLSLVDTVVGSITVDCQKWMKTTGRVSKNPRVTAHRCSLITDWIVQKYDYYVYDAQRQNPQFWERVMSEMQTERPVSMGSFYS